MSIVSALTLMGGATYAAFSDTVTQTANTFAAGDANLEIAADTGSGPDDFGGTLTGPNFEGMFPGETRSFEFWLRNVSDADIDLALSSDITDITPLDDAAVDGGNEIDNVLMVSWVCDTSGNGGLEETPTTEQSARALYNGASISLNATLEPTEQMICRMIGRLPSTADNTVAGDEVEFDVTYTGDQSPAPSATP